MIFEVHRWLLIGALALASLSWTQPSAAYDSLLSRLPNLSSASALLRTAEARASFKAGSLFGHAYEHRELLPNRTLRVKQTRTITKVRHPESGAVVSLKEPWSAHTTIEISSAMRLLSADTRTKFHRSIDQALGGYAFTEKHPEVFAQDHTRVAANTKGDRLTRTTWLMGKGVKAESYAYPKDVIPLEIAGFVLAAAIKNRVQQFDFELLLPGGDTHGIRSEVHRTQNLSRFTKGYANVAKQLRYQGEYAVIEMRLASPIKRIFFPHRVYLAYASDDPATVLALWGGDPEQSLQAVKID